ncbi:response regulator [Sagittula sp. S175]|uniref:response regulator n=1 Tax=Sagittula sp. S175 TaxID=3415129 RepID=UPI003C7B70C4
MGKTEQLCLIVDDQEFDRRMMRRVLAKEFPNIPLLVAKDLKEARARLNDRNVTMVFLDNALPDGMGVDFVRELAASEQFRRVPVVIVSDFPTPFMYAKAQAANVREVWSKRDFLGPSVRRVMQRYAVAS